MFDIYGRRRCQTSTLSYMMTYIYITIFIFGTLIGSFLNCLIYRLENKKGFVLGRSICPKCKHKLAWYDLIPIFSFILLKAKCRYCKKAISWQYPVIEITAGLLFIFLFYHLSFEINLSFVIFVFYLLLNACYFHIRFKAFYYP